jgi:hypothetical protein
LSQEEKKGEGEETVRETIERQQREREADRQKGESFKSTVL